MISKKRQYKHIIWDWNGTLINDVWLCVEVLNNILTSHGKELTSVEQYRGEFTHPVKAYYEGLGFDFSKIHYDEIAIAYHGEYDRRRIECDLHDNAERILTRLADCGMTHSVLSAYEQNRLRKTIGQFNIDHLFKEIAGLTDFYAKSKIDRGRELLTELDTTADQALIIGDTIHDYEVADAVGADCILIANGHNHRSMLQNCDTTIIDSIAELESLLC